MIKKFPMLYKKTSTGKIQTWEVWVDGATMCSESGQLDGKKIFSSDTIKEGKNLGRTNATTVQEQAIAEAGARWTAKKKKGYVEKINDAHEDKVDEIIEGGVNPMLAQSYAKHGDKIPFPCATQPKLDGIRSPAVTGALWTRTRKAILSVPHIVRELFALKLNKDSLDGELYNHLFKNDFEKITHIVNQKKEPDPNHELVQYHVYDIPVNLPFSKRIELLNDLKKRLPKNSPIKVVETIIVNDEVELIAAYEKFKAEGYEGAMVRDLNTVYENKRSYSLQKMKEFEDAEFEIVDVEEGRGKLQGHVGAFVCMTADETRFKVKMAGDTAKLREYWIHQKQYMGEFLTVKFQGLTGKNGVPRFPVGLRIRNYE